MIVRTARLRLEPIGPKHATDLWQLHNDAAVAEWYGGTWSREEAADYAVNAHHAWQTDGVHKWMAFDKVTDRLVGRGGLSWRQFPAGMRLEVGWALHHHAWGQGYATEIGRAALAHAFDTLEAAEVVAYTEVHNTRSRQVMERLGMRYAYDILGRGLVAGHAGLYDDAPFALYIINRADWRNR